MQGAEPDRRVSPREHPKGTSDHVTSSSKGSPTGNVWSDIAQLPVAYARTQLNVWLRHFQLKGPTTVDIAQLPVAHAQTSPKGMPFVVKWLMSLPVAMSVIL